VAPGGVDLPAGTVTVSDAASFTVKTDDKLFNLGITPSVRVYAIRNKNLTVCDYRANDCGNTTDANNTTPNGDVWVPVANNVVSLRAEYGRDTTSAAASATVLAGSMAGVVNVWDQVRPTNTTPPVPTVSSNSTKDTYACGLIRTSAVRIALVARSSQPEKTLDWPLLTQHVTPSERAWTNRVWMGSDDAAKAIDSAEAVRVGIFPPSPDVNWPTWQDFRYKVFQTVVPLRNITSQGVLAEC
ncbi:MAG: PilW family protein, partial [Betaproteobacteria bacterium]